MRWQALTATVALFALIATPQALAQAFRQADTGDRPLPPEVPSTSMRAWWRIRWRKCSVSRSSSTKAGASGMIGADLVAKSAPDGYTLLLGNIASLAINAGIYPKMSYDPVRISRRSSAPSTSTT
jgi:hypothetical protein